MPVSVIPSGQETGSKKQRKNLTSRKRRRNQNVEIDELASLVPLSTPLVSSDNPAYSLVPVATASVDKLSVIRLAMAFMKLKEFMNETSSVVSGKDGEYQSSNKLLGEMEEAMDGFLIVLDKEANVIYVSETITSHLGLTQQDVIGQNLADITSPDSATGIADALRPTAIAMSSAAEKGTVSQFRQFCVEFKARSSPTIHKHQIRVSGNLRLKLPPKAKGIAVGGVDVLEPEVLGFTGECRLMDPVSSIVEISVSQCTFTMIKDGNKKMTYIEASVKALLGYEPEDFLSNPKCFDDFVHPVDYEELKEEGEQTTKTLMKKGHAVSPCFRMLSRSGDWVWVQMEGTLHYKSGTSILQYYEYKIRVLRQAGSKQKCIGNSYTPEYTQHVGSTNASVKVSLTNQQGPTNTQTQGHNKMSSVASDSVSSLLSPSNSSVAPSTPNSSIQSPSKAYTGSNGSINASLSTTSLGHSPAISSPTHSNTPSPYTPPLLQIEPPFPALSDGVGDSTSQIGWATTAVSGDNYFSPQPANGWLQYEGGSPPKTPSLYDSPVSSTSSHPTNALHSCSGMGIELHTTTVTDSIPPASSDPFQDSHTSNFIPQTHFNDFNSRISNSTTPHQSNVFLDSVPDIDCAMLGDGLFNTSNPSINQASDSVLQELLSEIIELNDDSDFLPEPSDQRGTSHMNSTSVPSHSHAKFVVDSSASTPFEGFQTVNLSSSNPEVQDILRQFM